MLCHPQTQLPCSAKFSPKCLSVAPSRVCLLLSSALSLPSLDSSYELRPRLVFLFPSYQLQFICQIAARVAFSKWQSDLVIVYPPLLTFKSCPQLQDKHQNPCGSGTRQLLLTLRGLCNAAFCTETSSRLCLCPQGSPFPAHTL